MSEFAKTPESNRAPPDGYVEEWDDKIWNVGHVFMWSDAYETWADCGCRLTVKPGQTLAEAWNAKLKYASDQFEIFMDEPMRDDYTLFFVEE